MARTFGGDCGRLGERKVGLGSKCTLAAPPVPPRTTPSAHRVRPAHQPFHPTCDFRLLTSVLPTNHQPLTTSLCYNTPMDLLLAHGYFLAEDAHERKVMKPYPTLGLLYLSSYLKARGYAVGVFDATFHSFADFEAHLR